MKNYLLIFISFYSLLAFSQKNQIEENYLLIKDDSIMKNFIELNEVILLPKIKFSKREKLVEYLILKRKTIKVYPYAKLASIRLDTLYSRLNNIKRKGSKKKYIKQIQRYYEGELTDELKKLTRTEGQILIKLINRQTDFTVYEVIKDLKRGFNAFIFNVTAKAFNLSLKETYSPLEVKEDYFIEDILQKAFQSGILEYSSPKKSIPDLFYLKKIWASKESKLK
ncbi:DUF4294 domain-containing protein [Flavobacteriaceae bacterium]|jgi:hypothetical protein|nr:DUF4294 domain-containing protein [Flavobacteriaceae bacterium]MDC0909505.1 DUF4294 domain-containing protein [Flavobacteriaceae bacterium]MDC1371263.1 DUF4294 domain-containing protein [Flavobacteriaceae bacterium]